jgi:hypothetical protein
MVFFCVYEKAILPDSLGSKVAWFEYIFII